MSGGGIRGDPTDPGGGPGVADLVVRDALLVATVDDRRSEIAGGWVAVTAGLVSGVGAASDVPPQATTTLRADGCLVTPGLVNTHHHIYQNLTRAFAPADLGVPVRLADRPSTPAGPASTRRPPTSPPGSGLAELALGGCTTTTDHLYVHPRGGGDLISAEIAAATELGMRFHPTRGSMSLSVRRTVACHLTSAVQDDDEILADSRARSSRDPP